MLVQNERQTKSQLLFPRLVSTFYHAMWHLSGSIQFTSIRRKSLLGLTKRGGRWLGVVGLRHLIVPISIPETFICNSRACIGWSIQPGSIRTARLVRGHCQSGSHSVLWGWSIWCGVSVWLVLSDRYSDCRNQFGLTCDVTWARGWIDWKGSGNKWMWTECEWSV